MKLKGLLRAAYAYVKECRLSHDIRHHPERVPKEENPLCPEHYLAKYSDELEAISKGRDPSARDEHKQWQAVSAADLARRAFASWGMPPTEAARVAIKVLLKTDRKVGSQERVKSKHRASYVPKYPRR